MFVCCECCVLSSRGLCDGLITRPEESYRLWCVLVCDLETSRMRRLKSARAVNAREGEKKIKDCGPYETKTEILVIFSECYRGHSQSEMSYKNGTHSHVLGIYCYRNVKLSNNRRNST